jgi:hypothetical protein
LCQGWRGNCNIQHLLYRYDGDEIDVGDISRVTNYVVYYSCKGNETEIQEKLSLKSIILKVEINHGDQRDVTKLAVGNTTSQRSMQNLGDIETRSYTPAGWARFV